MSKGRSWPEVGTQLLRGVGGGLIVGIPLLYTMEVWWIGMYIDDWFIVGAILFGLTLNTGLNHASGFLETHDIWGDLRASVIAYGAASMIVTIILLLINTIKPGLSFSSIVSMVALGALPVSIGFSVANTEFGGGGRVNEDTQNEDPAGGDRGSRSQDDAKRRTQADLQDVGITVAGATVFVLAMAPAAEMEMISARTTGYHWAGLIAFSLLITYAIVFVADFAGRQERRENDGLLQKAVPETILCYVLSAGAALFLLFLLGQSKDWVTASNVIANAAVAGLPAAVGGAAGRLIL